MTGFRAARRLALAVVFGVALVVAAAAPAAAHATLVGTSPIAGAQLDDAPDRIVVRFDQPVDVPTGGIRLYDSEGERLELSRAGADPADPNAVQVLAPDLDDGVYVVTWRVVSADSHPIRGAFTFRVGDVAAADTEALVGRLLAAQGGSTTVGAMYAGLRFVLFASLAVVVGGFAFLLFVWRDGFARVGASRILQVALAAAAASTLLSIGVQGAYAAGLPLADSVDPSVIREALGSRYGTAAVARVGLLAAVALLWLVRQHHLALVAGVGALVSVAVAGHAGAADNVVAATLSNSVHLTAVSVWVGGLPFLLIARGADRVGARFSRLALVLVGVVVVTGGLLAWREVGSWDAATATTYGRLLLTKLGLFALLVLLALVSRRVVQARRGGLRQPVTAEIVVAVAVLAVTALLVATVPARDALARPFSTDVVMADGLRVSVTVDPARVGRAELHFYVFGPAGGLQDVEEFTATLALPAEDIGPLTVPLEPAGPGHFVAPAFDIPIRGEWQLELAVRTSPVDQSREIATVPVR